MYLIHYQVVITLVSIATLWIKQLIIHQKVSYGKIRFVAHKQQKNNKYAKCITYIICEFLLI